MSGDWESRFEGLGDEYFPGSSEKIPKQRKPHPVPAAGKSALWDSTPSYFSVDGVDYEIFFIGHLAKALNRKPVTIRLWEDQGFIPETARAKTVHPNVGRRLYSRAQIEGLISIAEEEGIYESAHARLNRTGFKQKASDLFVALAKRPLNGAVPKGEQ